VHKINANFGPLHGYFFYMDKLMGDPGHDRRVCQMCRKNRLLYYVAQPFCTKLNFTTMNKQKKTLTYNTIHQHSLTTFAFVEKAVHFTHKLSVRKHVGDLIELATFCLVYQCLNQMHHRLTRSI